MTILIGWSIAGGLGCGRSSRSSAAFRSAQVAFGRVLSQVEDDDFVRSARAANVKLNRLADGAILLLDGLVVRDNVDRVFVVLVVHFFQRNLNRANMLRTFLRLRERELEDVTFAETLQFLDLVMIGSD